MKFYKFQQPQFPRAQGMPDKPLMPLDYSFAGDRLSKQRSCISNECRRFDITKIWHENVHTFVAGTGLCGVYSHLNELIAMMPYSRMNFAPDIVFKNSFAIDSCLASRDELERYFLHPEYNNDEACSSSRGIMGVLGNVKCFKPYKKNVTSARNTCSNVHASPETYLQQQALHLKLVNMPAWNGLDKLILNWAKPCRLMTCCYNCWLI